MKTKKGNNEKSIGVFIINMERKPKYKIKIAKDIDDY